MMMMMMVICISMMVALQFAIMQFASCMLACRVFFIFV